MADSIRADFGIQVNFNPGTPDPARVFRTMTSLIDSFQKFDKELVQSIDNKIEPVLILEDIEAGSLRTWLHSIVTSVDDSGLKEGDWKKVVGAYLLKAKYIIVRKLEDKTEITTRDQIKEIERDLFQAAIDTEIRLIPLYQPIPEARLIETIQNISNALLPLAKDDSAKLITSQGEANFNLTLSVSPESMRELLVKETIAGTSTLLLKVKRPDYLGDSMWDFKYGDHPIQAKITDRQWLTDFQARKIDVRPGDAIRAEVNLVTDYGYEAEVISHRYEVEKVLAVIPLPSASQSLLIDGKSEE